jgi:hypothetical protein
VLERSKKKLRHREQGRKKIEEEIDEKIARMKVDREREVGKGREEYERDKQQERMKCS